MRNIVVVVEGLDGIQDVSRMGTEIGFNAVRAINTTARRFRTTAARMIRDQVAFPSNYLNPAGKKLFVAREATRADPTATIRATGRPTSLARFVTQGTLNKKGVTLRVDPNRSTSIKSAFLIKLPAGKVTDTKSNFGLAIRLRKGETIQNKRNMIKLSRGLYLLYGPSVDQVFLAASGSRAGEGVATEMTPDMLDFMEKEFFRLMGLQ